MDDDVLHGYLQHHWTGATAGLAVFRRVADTYPDPSVAAATTELAAEIDQDRESLRRIMHAVGATPSTVGTVAGKAGELVGRLKPNGSLLSRTPLTDLVEIEALCDAVFAKHSGWEALRTIADDDPRLDADVLDELLARADRQLDRLTDLHKQIARKRIVA